MKAMLRGNESVAYGFKLARIKVFPMFPITPSTLVPERMSKFIADGELDTEFIPLESEHSAISAAIGASLSGARVGTATASQGLALMHEILFIASGMRLPIVMGIGNRALSAPINIWCDHQDTISQRDTGWMQFYAENNQEGLDLILMAFKISEDKRVLLPSMVGLDAFVLTHTMEAVDIPEQKDVDDFLGEFKPNYRIIDVSNPATFGSFVSPKYYMEFKYAQQFAMKRAGDVINEVFNKFEKKFGRKYKKISEESTEDADIIFVTMGSCTGTAREFIKIARKEGKKVGLIKLTVFRPFPKEELRKALKGKKVVAVIERNISLGFGGAVYGEITSSLLNTENPPKVLDFIVGLGGRDITLNTFEKILKISEDAIKGKAKEINWIEVNKKDVEKEEIE